VPILIGLTAIVRKGQEEAAAEIAQAAKLFETAVKALDAGNQAKARGLLKQSIEANPRFAPAHQKLADLCERAGDETGALAAYRGWAEAGAVTPLPYNRIGEILEKRKDTKGALEAYTKSLEVEWNQPPTINAKARMERLLDGR